MLKIHLMILEKKINLYLNLNLNQLWSPSISHIINLIHHMPQLIIIPVRQSVLIFLLLI